MIKILCNLIIPGLGSLLMKKPITGLIQLILFVVASLLVLSVFMTFLGILLWLIDLVWAFFVSIQWWRRRGTPRPIDTALPIRHCDCDDAARLIATEHNWDLYNAVSKYQCASCGKSVAIIPALHIGYTLTVGLLVILMVSYFYIWNSSNPGLGVYSIVAVLVVVQAAMTFSQLAPHGVYPVVEDSEQDASSPQDLGRPSMKGAAFFKGMALPVLVITLLLGVSAMLGFVHDYYFPKP